MLWCKKLWVVLVPMLAWSGAVASAGALAGRVVDEQTGEAIVGAYASLHTLVLRGDPPETVFVPVTTVLTDERGAFAIAGLPAALYSLYVSSGDPQYVPEYYNDVPLRNGVRRELIELGEYEQRSLDPIGLTPSPYYFAALSVTPEDVFETGGQGRIRTAVVNNTRERVIFRFWSVLEVFRNDDSIHHGCVSRFSPSRPQTFVLWPGENEIAIPLSVPARELPESYLHLTVHGGLSYWEPMVRGSLRRLPSPASAPFEEEEEAPAAPAAPPPAPPARGPGPEPPEEPEAPQPVTAAGREPGAPLPLGAAPRLAPLPPGAFALQAPLPAGLLKPVLRPPAAGAAPAGAGAGVLPSFSLGLTL